MVSFPPSKINLGLSIFSKRPDGYHNLETVFYPVPWTDILEIVPSGKLSFECSGNAIPGREEDNLCLKAYWLLKNDFNIGPVRIYLHKIIPTGAGLGGGSSDASYTLRALNEIFKLGLTMTRLSEYASRLGSDCAFFCYDEAMFGTGRGEVLQKIEVDLTGKFLVLINPGIHVSTAQAFANVVPRKSESSLLPFFHQPLSEWKSVLKNDFEESVFNSYPMVKKIKDDLYALGAAYSSMSGSGSSVFGIFENEIKLPSPLSARSHWSGLL